MEYANMGLLAWVTKKAFATKGDTTNVADKGASFELLLTTNLCSMVTNIFADC